MHISFIEAIDDIPAEQWNAVAGTDYPFTRHEFLDALESSGTVSRKTGWQPQHVLVYNHQLMLIAVMPLYLKFHSYGEYVFDWSWADAYQQRGMDYYPKLLAAIPFTPATGPRLCIKSDQDNAAITAFIVQQLQQHAALTNASSLHLLFPDSDASQQLAERGLSQRLGVQYHWFNQGYQCFEDFLDSFSSRKRKNLNKERRRVAEQGLSLEVIAGTDISAQDWQRFFYFYQLTYAKRSGHGGYLNQQFFEIIAATMASHLVLVLAHDSNETVAGALNFRDSKTLYGRYWGCSREYDFLHFEACYYQGIDYCIQHQLQRFDPGAQGEHKIQRGFTPIETWSNHWMVEPAFSNAINDFLHREQRATADYIKQAKNLLPFKKTQ